MKFSLGYFCLFASSLFILTLAQVRRKVFEQNKEKEDDRFSDMESDSDLPRDQHRRVHIIRTNTGQFMNVMGVKRKSALEFLNNSKNFGNIGNGAGTIANDRKGKWRFDNQDGKLPSKPDENLPTRFNYQLQANELRKSGSSGGKKSPTTVSQVTVEDRVASPRVVQKYSQESFNTGKNIKVFEVRATQLPPSSIFGQSSNNNKKLTNNNNRKRG